MWLNGRNVWDISLFDFITRAAVGESAFPTSILPIRANVRTHCQHLVNPPASSILFRRCSFPCSSRGNTIRAEEATRSACLGKNRGGEKARHSHVREAKMHAYRYVCVCVTGCGDISYLTDIPIPFPSGILEPRMGVSVFETSPRKIAGKYRDKMILVTEICKNARNVGELGFFTRILETTGFFN